MNYSTSFQVCKLQYILEYRINDIISPHKRQNIKVCATKVQKVQKMIQWNLDLRKILGVTKIFPKWRFLLISNTKNNHKTRRELIRSKTAGKMTFSKISSPTLELQLINKFWISFYKILDIGDAMAEQTFKP